jgi:hypothetical protein
MDQCENVPVVFQACGKRCLAKALLPRCSFRNGSLFLFALSFLYWPKLLVLEHLTLEIFTFHSTDFWRRV